MKGASLRARTVRDLQAISKAARSLIADWKPDGGFARRGITVMPEDDPAKWNRVALVALAIADRAIELAQFANDQRLRLEAEPTVVAGGGADTTPDGAR